MTLTQLEYFLQIIEYGSISRAAKALYLSQPALSQQVKVLEDELGTKLFNRIGNKLVLTETGKILQKTAIKTLGCLNSGKEQISHFKNGFSGTLSVGISRNSSIEYLPNWLKNFSDLHSKIKYFIHNHELEELIDMMEENNVDLIFTRNLPKDSSFLKQVQCMPIKNDRIMAVCPKGDFPSEANSISLKDLDKKPMVLRFSLEKRFLERCQSVGSTPIIKCLCDDVNTTLMLVNEGMGYGLVPESCKCLLNMLDLQLIDIEEMKVEKKCYVIYPKEDLNPLVKNLLKIILSEDMQDREYI